MIKILEEDIKTIANAPIEWRRFEGKTILITGATGYVPRHFVYGFLKRNELFRSDIRVIAWCRNRMKAEKVFGEYLDREELEFIIGDVLDDVEIEEKIDFIIHAASPAGVRISNEHPISTFEANVLGCSNLLKLAKKNHAELLFLSSIDVYGTSQKPRVAEKDIGVLDPLDVRNVYAVAKRASENLCSCYGSEGEICKIVRPGQIMGCGIELDDGRLHIDFISQLLKGDKIVLKGDGTPVRTFIYMTDAIIGMLTVMTVGKNGEAYNVCMESGEVCVSEFARLMAGQIKGRKIEVVVNRRPDNADLEVKHAVSRVCASSEKLRGLGWRAQVSLPEACRRMMSYYSVPM